MAAATEPLPIHLKECWHRQIGGVPVEQIRPYPCICKRVLRDHDEENAQRLRDRGFSVTKPTAEFLTFELMPRRSGRRTDTWRVENAHHGFFLGIVSWYAPWRQYAFTPASGSTWSAGCLAAVNDFIAARMAERRRS